jgi:hypothetical protein
MVLGPSSTTDPEVTNQSTSTDGTPLPKLSVTLSDIGSANGIPTCWN